MANYLKTAKSANNKIPRASIDGRIADQLAKTLSASIGEILLAHGATNIEISDIDTDAPAVTYRINDIQRVHSFKLSVEHRDHTSETICNQFTRGFEITQPKEANYIHQLTNSMLNCYLPQLLSLHDDVLDAIEDCIINRGLYYLNCLMPVHNVSAKFIPYVNAFHPHHAVKNVREFVTQFGLAFLVDVIPVDMCSPEDDLLFEIGKVDYDHSKAKRSSLYANTKGKIFSSALANPHGYPVLSAYFKEFDQHGRTYVDDNGNTRKMNSASFRFDKLGDRFNGKVGLRLQQDDRLILFDVTSQVLPLIQPNSRIYNFLQATQCK